MAQKTVRLVFSRSRLAQHNRHPYLCQLNNLNHSFHVVRFGLISPLMWAYSVAAPELQEADFAPSRITAPDKAEILQSTDLLYDSGCRVQFS